MGVGTVDFVGTVVDVVVVVVEKWRGDEEECCGEKRMLKCRLKELVKSDSKAVTSSRNAQK